MADVIFNDRLRAITNMKCAECERYAAAATGRARLDRDRYFAEYRCTDCDEVFFAWFLDTDGMIARILEPPAPEPPRLLRDEPFPRENDRIAKRRAARLQATHDWDGAKPYTYVLQLYLSASGEAELERIDRGTLAVESRTTRKLSIDETCRVLDALAASRPADWRAQIGRVVSLDTVHEETLAYFDGEHAFHCARIFGTERGLGVVYGGDPPSTEEAQAFETLIDVLRDLQHV